jgi:hypothetical protein
MSVSHSSLLPPGPSHQQHCLLGLCMPVISPPCPFVVSSLCQHSPHSSHIELVRPIRTPYSLTLSASLQFSTPGLRPNMCCHLSQAASPHTSPTSLTQPCQPLHAPADQPNVPPLCLCPLPFQYCPSTESPPGLTSGSHAIASDTSPVVLCLSILHHVAFCYHLVFHSLIW